MKYVVLVSLLHSVITCTELELMKKHILHLHSTLGIVHVQRLHVFATLRNYLLSNCLESNSSISSINGQPYGCDCVLYCITTLVWQCFVCRHCICKEQQLRKVVQF